MIKIMFIAAMLFAAPIHSAMAQESSTPLMTIRFYRGNVDYKQSLFQAMAQAMQANPDLGFKVVAASPENSDGSTAEKYMRQVIKDMNSIGMPPEKVTPSRLTERGIEGAEVRIYVSAR